MKKQSSTPSPSWKDCIIFGVVNVGLVLLCTKLPIMILSLSLGLLLIGGVIVTPKFIKDDWKAGYKISAFGCIIGFLLQCLACALYVVNVLSNFISMAKG